MEARRAYFQEYWKKNKAEISGRTKVYRKSIRTREAAAKKEGRDFTKDDVWNVRRSKDCFEYPKWYIKFMQPIVRVD